MFVMAKKRKKSSVGKPYDRRRRYDEEFKAEAVRMLLDGLSAQTVADNLGLSGTSILYRWKTQILQGEGQAASRWMPVFENSKSNSGESNESVMS